MAYKRPSIKHRIKDRKKYYSKEDIFLSRVASILKVPQGVVHNLLSERSLTTIRLNRLMGKTEETKETLSNMGAKLIEVPWSVDTYIVGNTDKSDLAQTQLYKQGMFYIQNLSSMIPAIILNPQPNEIVLDMCAAPGSKTTQLAGMMGNKGKIVANDDDAFRGEKLRHILTMFGVKNTEVKIGKGEYIGKREENHYDKILLDAPCSGEGMIYLRGDKPLRFWNVKKVKGMSKIQKDLIISAFKALKKGGTLVYSTCTFEPEENEAVVTHLLDKEDHAYVETIDLFNDPSFKEYRSDIKRALPEWNGEMYAPEVLNTFRVYPGAKMMGFYVAKITKK